MFLRYEINQGLTNNTATCQAIMSDIYGVLTGTITATSGFDALYCNRALSEITGDMTALQPTNNAVNTYYNHAYSNGRITFNKRHNEHDSTYNLYGRVLIGWNYTTDYPKFRAGSNSYWWPYNNDNGSYYWASSDANHNISYQPSNMRRISIFASKYWFIIQFEQTDGKVATAGVLDHTINELDKYANSANTSIYNSMVTFHSIMSNPSDDTGGDSTYDMFTIGKRGYTRMAQGPSNANTQISYTGQGHMGYMDTNDYYIALYPFGSHYCQPQYDINDNNTAKSPLHPLHVIGLAANYTSPYVLAKVPEFYRTQDQIAANSEDITIGSQEYKCVRMHKTGYYQVNSTSANKVACYLIPKTIGGN